MKKLLSFISAFLVLGAVAFADVSVKKLDDGKVEVRFFYGNPRAQEVVIAGDFTNWQNGALPMTKVEKGWEFVTTVPAGTVMKYKFISDGNWTEDLREPDKVDDGFGGFNGLVDVDVMVAALGGGSDGAPKGKTNVKFMSWTMVGTQAKFLTQGASDATKKGMDLDSVSVGLKSYDKLTGSLFGTMPFYVEIALAETELDDAYSSNSPIYLLRKGTDGTDTVALKDGLFNALNGLFTSPVAYLSKASKNAGEDNGPGSNPYLGHLKFGVETPWVNYMTGFNYAKHNVRQAIIWKTVDGNWDAGYQHVGGFASFSLGNNIAHLLDSEGITLDAGFAPNMTADRKGTKTGYFGWIGAKWNDIAFDFQSNGMYDGDYIFTKPVEHDFILGAKGKFAGFSAAAQALLSTHQMSSEEITAAGASSQADYFGYSTDVFYRTNTFDGIQNIAAEVQLGYEDEDKLFGVTADYKLRGAQASMLYLRENHDDGTFDLSETLGALNTQNIALSAYYNPLEELALNLGVNATLPLQNLDSTDALVAGYTSDSAWTGWYAKRCGADMMPWFDKTGVELEFNPSASYVLDEEFTFSLDACAKLDLSKEGGVACKYSASDSAFLFKKAGFTFNWAADGDVVKGLTAYYGFDNSNAARLFNTLAASVNLPFDITASAGFGLKTVKGTEAGQAFNKDANNMIGGFVGCAKKLKILQSPTLYAQFVYNMDPYKNFGDGQDQFALDGANLSGRWDKGAAVGDIDAVDFYDGKAAVRVGLRWDI